MNVFVLTPQCMCETEKRCVCVGGLDAIASGICVCQCVYERECKREREEMRFIIGQICLRLR